MFHDDQLPREERARFHDAFGRVANAVCDCLGMILWVFEEVRHAAYEDKRDIHAVPLMLMLDFAEAIDGVAVLARSGAARNCAHPLRTGMEIMLSLKYMMERKDAYGQRCLAYEWFHLQDKLRWAQRCDPESQVGKQLRAELAGDPLADIFDVQGRDIDAEILDLKRRLASSRYAEVQAEVARMKAENVRSGGWFSLWGGPKNVRDLAYRLKAGSMYETLYRTWSSVTHGEGAIKRASGASGDNLQVQPIRSPAGLATMCRHACTLCNGLALFLVDGLVPNVREELRQRYIRDIQPGLAFIDSVRGL